MNKIEEIQKLKSLLDQEAITLDEYNLLKKNILEKDKEQQTSITTPIKASSKRKSKSVNAAENTQPEQILIPTILTQDHIDEFVATTNDYWHTFHQSMELPHIKDNSFKNIPFEKWIKSVMWDFNLKTQLKVLFEYALLKGEYYMGGYKNLLILTNNRLLVDDKTKGKLSIPLSKLIKYKEYQYGCKIVYEKNGKSVTLEYNYFIFEAIINSAKENFLERQISEVQIELMSKTISEIKFINPNLVIPKVDFNPSVSGVKSKSSNESISQINILSFFSGGFIKYAIGIAIIAFLMYKGNSPSSSDSSTSNTSTSEDRAVLYCNFCKKTVVAEKGKDLIYYTNEIDGCAVHAVNSGHYNALCSAQCCKAWRIAME